MFSIYCKIFIKSNWNDEQDEEKIIRKDRKGRVIGSYTNGMKISEQVKYILIL